MTPRLAGLCLSLLFALIPLAASGQTAPAPSAPQIGSAPSRLWLVAGGVSVTMRGDCQTCEEDFPYRHGGGLVANFGYRANDRMDVGAEVLWTSFETASGHIRTTHLDAIAQFRPWASKGFFVKGGAGMAFVRNWVDVTGPDAFNQKGLSVVIGAGWAFRPAARVGAQVFGAQHVGALGDLQTSGEPVADVVGNFWSFGAAVVIR